MNDIATSLLDRRVWYRMSPGDLIEAVGIVRAVYVAPGGVRLVIQTEHGRLEHIGAGSVRVES
jgi:hypothetical protein